MSMLLDCEIRDGMFSTERVVVIQCVDRRRSLLVDQRCILNGKLKVHLCMVDKETAVVSLPGQTFDGETRVSVPLTSIHPGDTTGADVVTGVLWQGGRFLLQRHGNDEIVTTAYAWGFPGGKIEPGESPEDALIREFDEEVGLAVKVGEMIQDYTVYTKKADRDFTYRVRWYVVYGATGTLQIKDRSLAVGYFTPAEALEMDGLPGFHEGIKKLWVRS